MNTLTYLIFGIIIGVIGVIAYQKIKTGALDASQKKFNLIEAKQLQKEKNIEKVLEMLTTKEKITNDDVQKA